MKLINLTPHDIVVEYKDGTRKVYPSSGQVARVEVEDVIVGNVDGLPVYKGKPKKLVGIPNPQDGVMYIVSLFVLQNANRDDLVSPNTNNAIRDDEGKIVAVRGWRK